MSKVLVLNKEQKFAGGQKSCPLATSLETLVSENQLSVAVSGPAKAAEHEKLEKQTKKQKKQKKQRDLHHINILVSDTHFLEQLATSPLAAKKWRDPRLLNWCLSHKSNIITAADFKSMLKELK